MTKRNQNPPTPTEQTTHDYRVGDIVYISGMLSSDEHPIVAIDGNSFRLDGPYGTIERYDIGSRHVRRADIRVGDYARTATGLAGFVHAIDTRAVIGQSTSNTVTLKHHGTYSFYPLETLYKVTAATYHQQEGHPDPPKPPPPTTKDAVLNSMNIKVENGITYYWEPPVT